MLTDSLSTGSIKGLGLGPGKCYVLLSTGGTAMRNRALSILRALHLIIEQCHVTYDCLDVNTHNFGSPPREGGVPGNRLKMDRNHRIRNLFILPGRVDRHGLCPSRRA